MTLNPKKYKINLKKKFKRTNSLIENILSNKH